MRCYISRFSFLHHRLTPRFPEDKLLLIRAPSLHIGTTSLKPWKHHEVEYMAFGEYDHLSLGVINAVNFSIDV
ncbi:hypothetical protein LZ554_001637 [Drepanopeziza brunnea f. sp. 'monogermtubi']|nr:hypothetical protein LZ554_001637 [Drepanopeziza brunnea f. sp. 'monogermtubi']